MIVLITSECKIRPSDGFEPRDICIYPFVAGREKAFSPGSGIGGVTRFVHTAAFPVAGCQEKRPVRLGMPDPGHTPRAHSAEYINSNGYPRWIQVRGATRFNEA